LYWRPDRDETIPSRTSTYGSAKPSQFSSQDSSSSGKEHKLGYEDTGYQLDYIASPKTPITAHYKDSPTTPTYRDGAASRDRLNSDTVPFNQLTEVESRAETAGAESTNGSRLDDVEAQRYWDDILSARVRTVRIDSAGVDEKGVKVERRKNDSS
jgi:hypothetical protein